MARLEDLIAEIESPALREAVAHEIEALKERTPFGLVFERHLPENVLLSPGAGLNAGDEVRLRKDPDDRAWWVTGRNGDTVILRDEAGEEAEASLSDILVLKGFGEPVYPTLTPLGTIERSDDRPYHAVINGENYHALQVMQHCWEGQVDCVYIDPPYNTGARDWKYNNNYVDSADAWRHSKWLSMMERRLLIAKRLLKPDAVLICTIDEHEVHHLGVLLEQLFPGVRRQLVTIVINPLGQPRSQELGRVEEYAYVLFCGNARPTPVADDLLNEASRGTDQKPRWERLLRGGTDSDRASRARMFYPVFIEPDTTRIVKVGEPLAPTASRQDVVAPDGQLVVWPVRTNGTEGRWRLAAHTLREYVEQGFAKVGSYDRANDRWSLLYLGDAMRRRIADGDVVVTSRDAVTGVVNVEYVNATTTVAKTVWNRGSHRAGEYGSRLLSDFLGEKRFPFPKSLYAVTDTLRIAVGDKPDAFIVDFFAGSATTLHATALLNRETDGRRRCAVVTNNEVEEVESARLRAQGLHPGDAEYERHGIFEATARPRVEAALSGLRPDGESVKGTYLDGASYADGFEENCEFYRLDYLNPDDVELGRAFDAVHPLLWLMAGAHSKRDDGIEPKVPFAVVEGGGYAVLFHEAAVRELVAVLNETAHVEHVFLVTNSEDAYAEMSEAIGPGRTTHMLYRDYLRSFRIKAS